MYRTNSIYFITHDRYLFQGQEMDDEVKGEGNSYDFGNRIYNPILGKFLSLDAFVSKYPSLSAYAFVYNNPISNIEIEGDSILFYSSSGTYLGYSNDNQRYKDKNLLVIIEDKDVKNFKDSYQKMRMLPNLTAPQKESKVASLTGMSKEIYDVTAFIAFFDKYKNLKDPDPNVHDGKGIKNTGDFKVEWEANLTYFLLNEGKYNELKVIAPNVSSANSDNSKTDVTSPQRSSLGSFHTHCNDGQPQGVGAPDDFEYARYHANGIFNVIVSTTGFNLFKVTGGTNNRAETQSLIQLTTHRFSSNNTLNDDKFTSKTNKKTGQGYGN